VWTQQGNKLVGTGAVGSADQGFSVALSGDGNTAILGGPGDNGGNNTGTGAAWVFVQPALQVSPATNIAASGTQGQALSALRVLWAWVPSSPCAYDRAGRRILARRPELGFMSDELLPSGARALPIAAGVRKPAQLHNKRHNRLFLRVRLPL
jgi:hypothetical protein